MCFGSKFSYTFYFTVFFVFFLIQTIFPVQLQVPFCSRGSCFLSYCSFLGAPFVTVFFETGCCMWFWLLKAGSYNGVMFAEPASINLVELIFSSKRQTVSGNDPNLLLRSPPRRKCLI